MEIFSALLAICAGNSPVTGEFPHKGQWRGALMFSLICTSINGWVNNREAVDLRRHRAHYDVTVICDSWYKLVVVHAYCISKVVIHVYQAFNRLIVFNSISMQYCPIFICAELQMQPNWTDTWMFDHIRLFGENICWYSEQYHHGRALFFQRYFKQLIALGNWHFDYFCDVFFSYLKITFIHLRFSYTCFFFHLLCPNLLLYHRSIIILWKWIMISATTKDMKSENLMPSSFQCYSASHMKY